MLFWPMKQKSNSWQQSRRECKSMFLEGKPLVQVLVTAQHLICMAWCTIAYLVFVYNSQGKYTYNYSGHLYHLYLCMWHAAITHWEFVLITPPYKKGFAFKMLIASRFWYLPAHVVCRRCYGVNYKNSYTWKYIYFLVPVLVRSPIPICKWLVNWLG